MKGLMIAAALFITMFSPRSMAQKPTQADCREGLLAGQLQIKKGLASSITLTRAGKATPLTAGQVVFCLWYGDHLEVTGHEFVDAKITAKSIVKTLGANGSQRWDAPPSPAQPQPSLGEFISRFAHMLTEAPPPINSVGQGPADCPSGNTNLARVQPLRLLTRTDQTIGGDLQRLVIGLKDPAASGEVQASLLRPDGTAVASSRPTCSGWLVMSLPAGTTGLRPGDHLTLRLTNGQHGKEFLYRIFVVPPTAIPTPAEPADAFHLGAWRLAEPGHDDLRLDGLARLPDPPDSYVGELIDAYLKTERPF